MKLEHIAVAANTREDADRFFGTLLGLEHAYDFVIPEELTTQIFGIQRPQPVIRYQDQAGTAGFEVFLTEAPERARDRFTHMCLVVEDRDDFAARARTMGFSVNKVPRAAGGYYLFVKDGFGNLYEVK